jgi:outer membrane protein
MLIDSFLRPAIPVFDGRRAGAVAGILRRWWLTLAILLVAIPSQRVAAQVEDSRDGPWLFTTRLLMTGSSDRSEPAGFQVYSAFTLEAGLRRSLGRNLAAELTIRTESREVDSLVPAGEARRLGSLELLPIDLLLQFHLPTGGALHPYVGAGVNLTVAWEKSGLLDSTDMAGSVGPAIQLGTDLDLSRYAVLNLDLKWNAMTATLENGGSRLTRIDLDPLSLGIGAGFRF